MNFPSRAIRWCASLGLGLFVLWQLLFLLGANFAEVAEHYQEHYQERAKRTNHRPAWVPESLAPRFDQWLDGRGRFHKAVKKTDKIASRWGEFLCQQQRWSLFAPGVWYETAFLAVEIRWDDGLPGQQALRDSQRPPVYLRSENEPADINRFLRWGRFRLRKYEENLTPELGPASTETPGEARLSWKDRIESKVRDKSDTVLAYLRWRWQQYQQAHPDLPEPNQVILVVRTFHIPAPPGPEPWSWDGPDECPMARWQPRSDGAAVEVYDPVAERFDTLD
jgi:hypothetical protein